MAWSLTRAAQSEELAAVCDGLADPKRVLLLAALRDGERSVGELAELIGAAQPSVSHHLGVLRSKGLVTVRRAGTRAFYRPSDARVIDALDILHSLATGEAARKPGAVRSGPPAPPPPRLG